MEDVVENGLELTNYLTDKYWDKGYDTVAGKLSRKQAKSQVRSSGSDNADAAAVAAAAASVPSVGHVGRSSAVSAPAFPFASPTPSTARVPQQSRYSRIYLPPPGRAPPFAYSQNAHRDARLDIESDTSERVLRDYEREADDPKRKLESVLCARDLDHLHHSRRDSAMAANDYQSRPRSQPPRSRYYDDDDSDYDEKTGRHYKGGAASNRGYSGGDYRDDRDYDVVLEETERYRGPPVQRQDSYRSGYDPAGAVTQYDRRSRRDDDRDTHVSRRSKSRARDRDRSYSGSRSRSGSRDGAKRRLEDHFDTSPRGIGIGIAGAVIGGLAGREFGKQHQKRDMLIGAIVGGLGANAAETKWRDWKDEKREREEDQRWEGRSRSTQR